MRNCWLSLLALTSITRAQDNNTALSAQALPSVSPSTQVTKESIQAQDYAQPVGTCKFTTTLYEYGPPSTSTIKVTVTSPKTCPNPVPITSTKTVTTTANPSGGYQVLPQPTTVTVTSPQTCSKPVPGTSTKTVTTTITPSRGYEVLPPPITVTVTKTTSVTNCGGYGVPPNTITITSVGSCSVRPPLTITSIRNYTTTKVCLISMLVSNIC